MSENRRRGVTLIEILITLGIVSILMLLIYEVFLRGTNQYNVGVWRQHVSERLEFTSTLLGKTMAEASYPTLNTFSGTARDKQSNFTFQVSDGDLDDGNAYSAATRNLADGAPQVDQAAAEEIRYFGSGVDDGLSSSESYDQEIARWVSCEPGYQDVPGFEGAPANPVCARHTLFLKRRVRVLKASEDTYHFYSDLMFKTEYSWAGPLTPTNILAGEGLYSATFSDTAGGGLKPEHRGMIGTKLLAPNVATVALKVYAKENDRSRTIELDIVCVAPFYGQAVVRKVMQANVGVRIEL